MLLEAVHSSDSVAFRYESLFLLSQIDRKDEQWIDMFWVGLLDRDQLIRDACVQGLVQVGRRLQDVERQRFDARLVRAMHAKKYEKVDDSEGKPAYDYIYEVLWSLVVEDRLES